MTYKQVELQKLLIRNWSLNNVDTTLMVIKDFVKKKKFRILSILYKCFTN